MARLMIRHMTSPAALGLELGALAAALALYFFARSQQLAAGASDFGGVFEAGVALLFGAFAAVALLSSGLALLVHRKSAPMSLAAAVIGIICGLIPLAILLTFVILERLG
jgi:hypothetical protein